MHRTYRTQNDNNITIILLNNRKYILSYCVGLNEWRIGKGQICYSGGHVNDDGPREWSPRRRFERGNLKKPPHEYNTTVKCCLFERAAQVNIRTVRVRIPINYILVNIYYILFMYTSMWTTVGVRKIYIYNAVRWTVTSQKKKNTLNNVFNVHRRDDTVANRRDGSQKLKISFLPLPLLLYRYHRILFYFKQYFI